MPDPDAPAWTITNQSETTDLGPDGQYVPGVKVTFRTARNVTGSVFVRRDDYRTDKVRQLVAEQAAVADEIAAMQG